MEGVKRGAGEVGRDDPQQRGVQEQNRQKLPKIPGSLELTPNDNVGGAGKDKKWKNEGVLDLEEKIGRKR